MGRGLYPQPWAPTGEWDGSYPVAPVFQIDVPSVNDSGVQHNAARQSLTKMGFWGYPSNIGFAVVNLSEGTYAEYDDGGHTSQLRSYFFDDLTNRIVVSRDNSLPTQRAAIVYVNAVSTTGSPLSDVLRWLAVRAGYDEDDVEIDAGLTDNVAGVLLDRPYGTGELFAALGRVYGFVYFESEGKIKFVKNHSDGTLSVAHELTVDDLAPISEGGAAENETLLTELGDNSETPVGISMSYIDPAADYTYSVATFHARNSIASDQGTTLDEVAVPVVMSKAEAYRRVAKVVLTVKEMSVTQQFRLPWKYMRLEPTDAVGVTVGTFRYVVRLGDITYNGDWSLSVLGINYAVNDDIAVDSDPVGGTVPQIVPGLSDSRPVVLDTTSFSADDDGGASATVYTGVASFGQPSWQGAALFEAPPAGSFAELYHTDRDMPAGAVSGTLPYGAPWVVDDETELTVFLRSMTTGQFASTDEDGLLAGDNAVLVGAEGRWELIHFRDVEAVNTKTVKLTGLVRGKRGTDAFVGDHEEGDTVYLVRSVADGFRSGITPTPFSVDRLGAAYRYKAVGDLRSFDPPVVEVTVAGYTLRPWAPSDYRAALSGSDVVITWKRRDRVSGSPLFVEDDVPLNEASEAYELEIYSGSMLKRTVSGLSAPTFTYTAAMQTTDGFTPPVASVKMRAYQISATVGRGFTREETVNVE